ncbi:AAA family ATPase [Mycobacteroides abscessus]|uniref:AAA family ATPase n=1 Tax=Mycobacteroides abscessus TaxID=36809 RepID=UPI001604F119|nr:AAA family ATPase [Mycobacteroides abscessus]
MSSERAIDRCRDAWQAAGLIWQDRTGDTADAQAPGHSPADRSVTFRQIEGQVLVNSHADDKTDVLTGVGLTVKDLFDNPGGATYDYPDGRIVHRSPAKRFRQSGNTKGRSLFRTSLGDAETVYVCEGEKDVLAAESVGAAATCPAMGAGKAHLFDWEPLRGKTVIVVADRDEPGRRHAAQVAELLDGIATSVRIMEAAEGKDAADHIAAGRTLDELVDADAGLPPRRARITWATEIEPEPVVWAWEDSAQGRIPAGSLSIAAGREGTGKSSFGIWMAASITRGTLPGSFYGKPRRVFYTAAEDSWKYTLVSRLIAAEADLSMIGRFEVVSDTDDELTLSLPHDNALLENEVRAHGVALVVIDPLMSVIGERIDTHREREVRSALDPLARIADRTGAVILGIAHFNKGSGTDAASLITGSGAFKNVPRSVFGFARDETDENGGRIMTQVKNSLGRDDLPSIGYVIESAEVATKKGIATTGKFVFTGKSERSVADVLRDARTSPEEHDERKEAAAWLVEYLTDNSGEMPAKDVFKAGQAEGYSRDILKRAKGKRVRSAKVGDGWVWQLIVGVSDQQGSTKGAREQETEPCSLAPLPAPLPTPDQIPNHTPTADPPPPGGLTAATPGQTARVQQILANANRYPRCTVCDKPVMAGQGDRHLSCTEGERTA